MEGLAVSALGNSGTGPAGNSDRTGHRRRPGIDCRYPAHFAARAATLILPVIPAW